MEDRTRVYAAVAFTMALFLGVQVGGLMLVEPLEAADKAFTQSEIREATGVKAGSISVVLSRLEDRGLVRHKGNYWALGEDDDVAAYTSLIESTRTANERFGEEDMDEWLEYAVDDEGGE